MVYVTGSTKNDGIISIPDILFQQNYTCTRSIKQCYDDCRQKSIHLILLDVLFIIFIM